MLEEVLESDDESSSVVVRLYPPPMRTRPAGDCQLECWDLPWRRLWLTTQPPARAEIFTQVRGVSQPPQLSSPSWVCRDLVVGRGGMVQEMGMPPAENTSTEVTSPDPPETIIAEIRFTYQKKIYL